MEVGYLWLIPALPLLGFIINGSLALAGARSSVGPSRKMVGTIATLLPVLSFAVTVVAVAEPGDVLTQHLWTWFSAGGLSADIGFLLDGLSGMMLLFITGIGSLIHLYSIGYMGEDRGFARFMSYLNLFMFSMIVLVLADNLVLTFLGWEGVGLCSYLLVGFWHQDHANNDAARKAFITNRVGDVGLLMGMFALVAVMGSAGTLDYASISAWFQANPEIAGTAGVTLATMFIFWGCTAKSAQIPLFTWLPDAMAGPTPVSALIHAATMVTSGVYLVARLGDVFALAPMTMNTIAIIGAFTALFAAIAALFQFDIKKVLAYSTVSQLGFMFMAVGVGAFDVALFHVFTHAFFKACLFLGAGSVIHALHHEQDMRRMGGLAKAMPITYAAFWFAWYAIIGLPLAAGFMSKDLILERLFISGGFGQFIFALALIAALLTAFYMTRLMALTFWSPKRWDEHHPPREVGAVMWIPVMVLGIGSLAAGIVWAEPVSAMFELVTPEVALDPDGNPVRITWFADWLAPVVSHAQETWHHVSHAPAHATPSALHIWLMALPGLAVALIGFGIAYALFRKGPKDAEVKPITGFGATWTWIFDTVYDWLVVRPVAGFARFFRAIDDELIGGIMVRSVGNFSLFMGSGFRGFQRGRVRVSLFCSTAGVVVVVVYALWPVLFHA